MTLKEKIDFVRKNFLYKTLFTSAVSLFITFAFAVYNAYLGIKFYDGFAIGISIYYLLLIWVKAATLIVEKILFRKDDDTKERMRAKNYRISSVIVFFIDFCLIAPIILMVTNPKEVNFGIIPAIAMAAYSTYKITAAIVNYSKSKKSKNFTIILLREINFIDALVSILTLQHTLIMVNGGMDEEMRTLSLVTSIGLIAVMILFSILSFYRNKRALAGKNNISGNKPC